MVDIDTLPDPGDPNWEDRVADVVEGSGVEHGLAEDLLRDAVRVARDDLEPGELDGRYPTRAVETLGVDELLETRVNGHDDLAVSYGAPSTNREGTATSTPDSEKESPPDTGDGGGGGCGSGCDCSCGSESAVPVRRPEDYLPPGMTPEEAGPDDVDVDFLDPEDIFPDEDVPMAMEDLGQDWDMDDVDEAWEANANEDLDDVEFDTDLGVEMSRDALRIAQGDLTKAEFHAKYNDAVLAEFGVDHRPTRHAKPPKTNGNGGELAGTMPSVPGRDGVPATSRRRFLKGAGAAASAGAVGGLAGCTANIAQQGTDPGSYDGDVHMGMAIDVERCIGCLLCAEGCMEENNTDLGSFWMHVFRYEEDERGDVAENYMPRPCQHCSEPSCSYVCPTQARYKRDEDGIVLTNYDTCIGCRYCQVACPYGVNYLGQGEGSDKSPGFWHPTVEDKDGIEAAGPAPEGVMGKCTFCVHRQDESSSRGTTACEDACPVDAIHFGDMEDSDSAPRQHMREKRETARFELLENQGNEPNIVYLGDEPSGKAEPTDGPYTYRDLDMAPLDESAEEVEDS